METLQRWIPLLDKSFWSPNKGSQLAEEYCYWIIGACVLYVPAILLGQHWMRNRTPFKPKAAAFVWNLTLSFLSAAGSILILRDDWTILLRAFYNEADYQPATRAVVILFCLTKSIEFGDTAFLVLMKKPLTFLHGYHHLTVTLYCWQAQLVNVAFAHHFVFINLCIHGIMYFYYALAIFIPRHPLLRSLRPYITMSQTLQMFVGMYLSYNALASSLESSHRVNAWLALAMYSSYAWLFAMFYLENYVKGVRPLMTLFVGSMHVMAVVGAYMVWHHPDVSRLLLELVGCYCLTACLLWLSRDSPSPSPHMLSLSSFKLKEANMESVPVAFNLAYDNTNSSLLSVCRISMMLLNCLATWAREHLTFRRRLEMLRASFKQPAGWLDEGGKSVTASAPSSPSRKLEDSSRSNTEARATTTTMLDIGAVKQQPNMSMLLSLVRKIDNGRSSAQGTQTLGESSSPAAVVDTTTDVAPSPCPPGRPFDLWLALLCFSIPAIYGLNVYGDLMLGLCVHGALRWVTELHTTGALVQDMHIAKFESRKRK